MRKLQSGFSLTELLVVIIAIGILTSIVIVSYRGFQNRAYDASIRSDLESITGVFEGYRARDDGTNDNHYYPLNAAALSTLNIKVSKNAYNASVSYNLIYCITDTGANAYKDYKIVALSKSGAVFMVTQDGFATHSLTAASLTSGLCSSLTMNTVSNGLSAPNTWQSWVLSS